MRISVVESAINTFTEAEFPTPLIAELGYVMEILRLLVDADPGDLEGNSNCDVAVYDRSRTAMPNLSDSGVLHHSRLESNVTTQGGTAWNNYYEVDFTDGAGNGLLYGKKSIFIAALGVGEVAVLDHHVAILYRLKKVNAAELVGLMAD